MKRPRVALVVREAVIEYSKQHKIPLGQFEILYRLAAKSYKNTPIAERDKWSLKAILEQGL